MWCGTDTSKMTVKEQNDVVASHANHHMLNIGRNIHPFFFAMRHCTASKMGSKFPLLMPDGWAGKVAISFTQLALK
jgi:hypothetical protein